MNQAHLFKSTAIKYGLYLSLVMIIMFLLMKVEDMSGSLGFGFVEVVMIYLITGRALDFYESHTPREQSYAKSIGLAIATSFCGMLFFVLFSFGYMAFSESDYLEHLREIVPMGPYLNVYLIGALIIIIGMFIGALSGFLQTFLIKEPHG